MEDERSDAGRVLLKWKPQFIERPISKGKSFTADYSIVLLTAEEMIAAGATELVVNLRPDDIKNLETRAPALKNRLIPADSRSAAEAVSSILAPAFEEHLIKNDLVYAFHYSKNTNHDMADKVVEVAGFLYDFLLATRHQAVLDTDFERFYNMVRNARIGSRNLKARMNLASIEGILNSYQKSELYCVQLKSSASTKAVELFNHFVEDSRYLQMSQKAHALGSPETLVEAREGFSRLAQSLTLSPQFEADTIGGELVVQAATSRPEILEGPDELAGRGYLPPMVSFHHIRERATKQYQLLRPDPLWPNLPSDRI